MTKFSIIIPVYNVASYLRECLDSLLAQTYNDWEAICVDDGSSDGSSVILDEYAACDLRFKVIHQHNAGVSSARNRGLEEATGEWIGFVDADDFVKSRWLESVNDIISKTPNADLVVFGLERFDEGGVLSKAKVPKDVLACGFCQFMYRRAVFLDIRFPPYAVGEDRVYLFKCLSRAKVFTICPDAFYRYRQRPGSVMHSYRSLRVRLHSFRHSIDLLCLVFKIRWATWRWKFRLIRKVVHRFWLLGVEIFKISREGDER